MIPGNSDLIDRVRVELSSKILAHSRMRSLVSDPLVFLFGVAQLFKLKCSLCGISSWCLQRCEAPKVDRGRPVSVGMACRGLARLALDDGHCEAGDRDWLASQRLPIVLDLERAPRATWTTISFA